MRSTVEKNAAKLKGQKKNNESRRNTDETSLLLSFQEEDNEKFDPYSTEDEATFNEIVQKKNKEIANLKNEVTNLK